MAKAYLKIWVESGKEKDILAKLRKMKGVKTADITAGEQDIIALVEGRTHDALLKMIVSTLRKVKGIARTATNLILE
ncbi:MAG: Lrp/AsnC ligand binding domain-containing protein [Planctomycetota bacterium]